MTDYKIGKRAVRFGYFVNNVFSTKPIIGTRFNIDSSLFVEKGNNGDVNLSFEKEKTAKIKEVSELLPGLYLVVTTKCFHICFNALKDEKKYKFAVIKDEPIVGKELKLYLIHQKNPYSRSLGWGKDCAIPKEVDDSFSKLGMYIVKAGKKVYLCTKR